MTIHIKFKNRQNVIYTANHSDMAKNTKVYNKQNSLNYMTLLFHSNYATILETCVSSKQIRPEQEEGVRKTAFP